MAVSSPPPRPPAPRPSRQRCAGCADRRENVTGTGPDCVGGRPGGLRKTTLLSQWAERNGQAFAWVSLADTAGARTLADTAGARTLVREIDEILRRRPGLGTLLAEAQALQTRLTAERPPGGPGASSLTAAELRLLPLLSTHLSFPEIAAQMFLSTKHHQVAGHLDLPETRSLITHPGRRTVTGTRAPGGVIPAARRCAMSVTVGTGQYRNGSRPGDTQGTPATQPCLLAFVLKWVLARGSVHLRCGTCWR
jgi:hypothetical protein